MGIVLCHRHYRWLEYWTFSQDVASLLMCARVSAQAARIKAATAKIMVFFMLNFLIFQNIKSEGCF